MARRSSMARMWFRCTATAIAEHSPAPRRPVAAREPKKASFSGLVTAIWDRIPASEGGCQSFPLIGIPVGHFVCDVIGQREVQR